MFVLGVIGSSAVYALDVSLSLVTTDANGLTSVTPLTPALSSGTTTVNLDSDTPVGTVQVGGSKTYFAGNTPVFTIAKCSGCAGRARVFVSEGSIDRIVFTDAQITNISGTAATLRINASSGPLSVSGPAGDYPYATELSGSFTAPLGQSATNPANNIQVTATASVAFGSGGGCEVGCTSPIQIIDNPAVDAGEDANNFSKYSLVAPPFLAGGLAQFAPKEQQILTCANLSDPETESTLCQPALQFVANISLASRHGARIPGSIGTFHVTEQCNPPAFTKGCEIMADFFASIGPKGFKVYDVRLQGSPGSQRTLVFRDGTQNSPDVWVTRRGDRDDDDDDGGQVSNTRAKLTTNGSGDLKASGLCPASGCPTTNTLPLRVYCGRDPSTSNEMVYETVLHLNGKGDGRAELSFSLACTDPAVLVMDPSNGYWVAAPAIF